MRIALVVHKFPPESTGGVETYCWSLARGLASAGHDVHVFYPLANLPHARAQVVKEGVNLWRVAIPGARPLEGPVPQFWHTFRDVAIETAFKEFLASAQPDIVHFQHVQGVSARLVELARGRPRLLTLQDYWFFCFNSQLLRPDQQMCDGPRFGWNCVDCATVRSDLEKYRLLRPVVALPLACRNIYLRKLVEQIDLFIAPSEFLRQQYIRQRFPSERMVTIEYGLDEKRLVEAPEPGLQPPPARPHFGFIGSIAWHKGVHVLVEAFNQLRPDASLTIYGGETAFPEYAAQVRAMSRHPHLRFAGPLEHRYVGSALRQFDCLVVPSIWYENSPLVIREAFTVGLPVVASRLGALAEKVDDGITGRLFNPGDSSDLARVLREMIAQPQQLALFAKNIRAGPDIHMHSELLVRIYRELAAGTPVSEIADEIRKGNGKIAED